MKFILLDAGGAGLVFVALIIFMIIAVVVEAVVMLVMKYNGVGKAFLDSFVVNMASLVVGYVLSSVVNNSVLSMTESVALNWLIIFLITVAVEFLVLFLINRARPLNKTLLVSVVMNVASYVILYFFIGIDW